MFKLLIALLPALVVSEKTWLKRFAPFPGPKTLELVHLITVEKDEVPEVRMQGPVTLTVKPEALKSKGLSVALLDTAALAYLDKTGEFCCTPLLVDSGRCKSADELTVPGSFRFPVNKDTLKNGFSKSFKPPKTGLYYVAVVNCDSVAASDSGPVAFSTGELETVGKSGYLPGEEAQKLAFYAYLSIAYIGLLVVWMVWCSRWTDVLFRIHHYITITIAVGLLEAICWYISLYHWNYLGHRLWSMVLLASVGTVVKQGVSYGLLLLACLGLGVTKPRLESKTLVQCFLVVFAFIITDGARQMSVLLQDRVNGITSFFWRVVLVTPGSLFASIIYVWIFSALQDTIADLAAQKQTVKAEVYLNLRVALLLVLAVTGSLVVYEAFVVRAADPGSNWQTKWVYTDVLSHVSFFFVLSVIMFLWRPSERSAQMAYSQQLAGDGIDAQELGNPTDDVEIGQDDDEFNFKQDVKEHVPGVLE